MSLLVLLVFQWDYKVILIPTPNLYKNLQATQAKFPSIIQQSISSMPLDDFSISCMKFSPETKLFPHQRLVVEVGLGSKMVRTLLFMKPIPIFYHVAQDLPVSLQLYLHLFPFFVCCAKEDELEYQQTLHLYVVASPYSAGKSQGKVSHH